jgi:Asp-tRNA(Asn)/Glu-tRNA(Gln) amidotransferase A subunit family amidase
MTQQATQQHGDSGGPAGWTAIQALEAMREGLLSSEQLVTACLERIGAIEQTVGAWAHLDPEHALGQARAADDARRGGKPLGPLHGIPVGVKDIFDTADMPTEDGTVLHAGRTPACDATAVARLREAGAVILGKTVTTELAVYAPGKTRNPHDPERTPGGSSSGSAAAVAADMVPLAIGSQTNGSVIRPASYCGVFGYKPTHGLISRYRVLSQSRRLDHVGVFARSLGDVALLAEQMIGHDAHDPDTRPRARPRLLEVAREEPPVEPRFAFVKGRLWDEADSDLREAFAELVEHLGDRVEEVVPTSQFDDAIEHHRVIMEADLARSFSREYERGRDQLSAVLREMIERGQQYRAVDYNAAVGQINVLNAELDEVFAEYDALITPATMGEAPTGLESTGSPGFCTTWTLCGVPSVTAPLLQGANGLPIGVQLVGARHDDARLLRSVNWLVGSLSE